MLKIEWLSEYVKVLRSIIILSNAYPTPNPISLNKFLRSWSPLILSNLVDDTPPLK